MAGKSLRRLQFECENTPEHDLADEEVTRYGKQMMVGVGVAGQRSIRQAKVLVVGVGAAGSAVLVQLSAAGVGELGLVDSSEFSETNPAKEPVFAGIKPGSKKINSAKDTLLDLNPLITVNLYPVSIQDLDHASIIPQYSILVCCTDDTLSRYRISDLAVTYNKPLVMACALKTEGHCFVLNREGAPCYRCLFPTPPGMGI
jgi:adenylyltransferase/sulfurtransferase